MEVSVVSGSFDLVFSADERKSSCLRTSPSGIDAAKGTAKVASSSSSFE